MKILLVASLCALFSFVRPLAAAPFISEFLAENSAGLRDEDGATSDWIEIQNPDATTADLTGWALTDDAGSKLKWRFPSVSIAPGGSLVVFASGKNRAVAGQQLHTNFSLNNSGEYLALVQPNGTTVVSEFNPQYPGQKANQSYGIAQTPVATDLVATVTPSVLVPLAVGDLPADWNQTSTGGTWITGTAPGGVGYDVGIVPVTSNVSNIGVATQSSELGGYPASNAVDGNTGNFTHTSGSAADANAWWQVAFPVPQDIGKIVLFNRGGGCCPERMRNLTVQILNAAGTAVYTSALLNPNNSLNGPASITLDLFGTLGSLQTGSRVRVTRTGGGGAIGDHDNYVLSLGEVQVFATAPNTVNAARITGAVATQSTELSGYPAALGIDGNLANFTHTTGAAGDVNPWWQVVLANEGQISNIILNNRSNCCPERLADITVQIYDAAGTLRWTSPTLNPGNTLAGPALIYVNVAGANGGNNVPGKRVRITKTGSSTILSLGEVQVNVTPPPATYNAAQSIGVVAFQSSEYGGYPAGNAIDGNTANFTHTSGAPADANAWLEVALPNDVALASLVIYNRGDGCCPERLRNFTVDVLDQADAVVWTSGLLNSNNTAPQAPYVLNLLPTNPTGLLGRKVKITRTGGGGVNDHDSYTLAIGELQINALVGVGPVVDTNVALAAVATGSSNIGFPEGNATNGNYGDFTHTASTDNAARLAIDLGGRKLISSITLYNRTSCCGSRMRDLTVKVLDTDNSTVVFQSALLNPENAGYAFPGGPGQIAVNLSALAGGSVPGRYVVITRTPDPDLSGSAGNGNTDESNVLSLGEVVVMGRAFDTYLPLIATNVKDSLYGKNTSAFMRYPFNVADVSALKSLKLRMRNDDAFVAYINGVKVAERRTPTTTPWNAVAPVERDDVSALVWEEIDISSAIASLNPGSNNVLAIQGLTAGLTDADFFVQPQLIANSLIVNAFASYLTTPTPGAQNNSTWFIDTVADTSFSVKRGFYTSAQTVAITSLTPGVDIWYSTNGEEPEPGQGTLYSGPLTISQTTVLRARAFKTNWKPTNVDTNTYIFLSDVVAQAANGQAPTGWPVSWGANSVNYGMDPAVRALYGDAALQAALTQIPTVSVVTEMANLFDAGTGIYANAGGHGDEWERPASFEWLDPNGAVGQQGKIQQNFGLRIRGGASRSSTVPKHSFRAYFRGEYGAGKLEFPIFGNTGASQYDVIDLASSQNYSWQGGDASDTMVRDPFSRTTLLATGSPACRNKYFQLYLNGLYWGLFYFDERVSGGYGEAYFGGNKDDYDVIKTANHNGGFATEATSGYLDTQPLVGGGTTTAAWKLLWDKARALAAAPTTAAYFEILGKNPDGTRNPTYPVLVDETSLIDYLLTIFYTGDGDAPLSAFLGSERANNWFSLRSRVNQDQGFTFYTHDAEHTVGAGASQNDRTGPWPSNPTAATNQNNFIYSNPQWLFQDLCASPEFRLKVADRAHRHFFNGGVMTTTSSQARIDDLASQINLAVKAHAQRWGSTSLNDAQWSSAVGVARGWLNGRTETVVQQLRNYRLTSALAIGSAPLYPNVVAPVFSQHGGNIPPAFGLTMTSTDVPAGTIYFSTNGTDPRAIGGAAVGSEYASSIPLSATTTVKARTLLNGNWSALTEAQFLVDVTPATNQNLVISEIHYHPVDLTTAEAVGLNATQLAAYADSDVFEFLELTNLSTSNVNLSGATFTAGISYTFPAGSIFPPGAKILLVKHADAFALRYGNSIVPNGVYGGKLSNNGETLTLTSTFGTVLATVTYVGAGDSDGGGPSLVIMRPEDLNYDAAHQRSSIQTNGNPGASDALRLTVNPLGDADKDGFPALVEYALGTSDTNGFQMPALPEVVKHGAGEIEIRFPFKANADDAIILPQGSPDITTWVDARTLAPTTEIINGPNPGDRIMIIRGPATIADGTRYFYRTNVQLK